jgi:hypothetical protein
MSWSFFFNYPINVEFWTMVFWMFVLMMLIFVIIFLPFYCCYKYSKIKFCIRCRVERFSKAKQYLISREQEYNNYPQYWFSGKKKKWVEVDVDDDIKLVNVCEEKITTTKIDNYPKSISVY